MRDDNEVINALRQCEAAIATWADANPPSAGFSVGQMGAMKSLRTALTNARAVLDAVARERGDSYEDIWNALWRITTVITVLPTYEVKREGGIKEVTDDVIDAILAAAEQLKERD